MKIADLERNKNWQATAEDKNQRQIAIMRGQPNGPFGGNFYLYDGNWTATAYPSSPEYPDGMPAYSGEEIRAKFTSGEFTLLKGTIPRTHPYVVVLVERRSVKGGVTVQSRHIFNCETEEFARNKFKALNLKLLAEQELINEADEELMRASKVLYRFDHNGNEEELERAELKTPNSSPSS